MSREKQSAFLDRGIYRLRRIADAGRLIPVLGAVLFLVPLLWGASGARPVPTSYVMVYLFLVWFGLIGVSSIISRLLKGADDTMDARKEE